MKLYKTYWSRASTEQCTLVPMPTCYPAAFRDLLKGLHDSEIRCGIRMNRQPAASPLD